MHDLYKLLNELNKNQAPNVILLHGPEDYLTDMAIEAVTGHYMEPEMLPLDFLRFTAGESSIEEIAEAAATLTMFSRGRVIMLSDVDKKEHGHDVIRGEAEERLIALINDMPAGNVLILVSKGKSKTKINNAVKKSGAPYEMRRLTHDELKSFIAKQLSAMECDFDERLAEEIAVLSGYLNNESSSGLHDLVNELRKIAAYSRSGKISRADVAELMADDDNSYVFALSNAVKSKNCDETYRILHNMLTRKQSTFSILPIFIFQFEDMLIYKEMHRGNYPLPEIQKRMGGQIVRLNKARSLADNYTYEEIAELLSLMYALGDHIKSGLLPNSLAIELLLSRMIVPPRPSSHTK